MDLGALIASVIVSVGTVAGSLAVARKFQKLGGGEAQARLNELNEDISKAADKRVQQLEDEFAGCKDKLTETIAKVDTMEATAAAAAKRWSLERIDLKQEIAALHEELRKLRPNRRGARDRSDD